MKVWPVQDAKARFSEFLDATVTEGPQIVTRRGGETAVLTVVLTRNLTIATRNVRDFAAFGVKILNSFEA